MPHSSGGGSHGGGAHFSSHSSGSSSFGGFDLSYTDLFGPKIRRRPFSGSTTYFYYRNKRPVYFYSVSDAKESLDDGVQLIVKIILGVTVLPFLMLLAYVCFVNGFHNPKPLPKVEDNAVIVEDNANVMSESEEDDLMRSLQAFYDSTGIVPAVVTINNDSWKDYGKSLEDFAYDEYVSRFQDESHWLIMYSEPVTPDPSFNDWYWEGMQGNDTDFILTGRVTREFTEDLQKRLLMNDITTAEAITLTFSEYSDKAMEKYVVVPLVILGGVFSLMAVLLAIYIFNPHLIRKKMLNDATRLNSSDKPGPDIEETCDYCGGIYLIGYHFSCPHCGAAIKAHDYTVDADGKVTAVLR